MSNDPIAALEAQMPPLYAHYKQLVTPSEVPTEFHVFAFMTMISALVGDRLYFREGNDIIYPNLWTMLVGPSGIAAKSTAIHPILRILKKTEKVNFLPAKGSPEGFFVSLVETKGVGLLYHTELGSILGPLRKDYMRGFVEDLCETYGPTPAGLIRRLSQSSHEVDHLAISWITATTVESLNKCEAGERIATGFLPRWNIIFGTAPSTYVPWRLPQHPTFFDDFVAKLKSFWPTTSSFEIYFDELTKSCYAEWYNWHRPTLVEGYIGYFARRTLEVVKKYALLLSLLNHHCPNIQKSDMQLAIQFGNYLLETGEYLIKSEITEDQNEAKLNKVLKTITRLQQEGLPLTRSHIYQYCNLTALNFKPIIATLEGRGLVSYNEGLGRWTVTALG